MSTPLFQGHHANGRWAIWLHADGVIASRLVGRMETDYSDALIRAVEEVLKGGDRYSGVHDWSRVENFNTRCQRDLTALGLRTRGKERHNIIWTSLVLVRMGVAVANLTLGGAMKIVSSQEELERALVPLGRSLAELLPPFPG